MITAEKEKIESLEKEAYYKTSRLFPEKRLKNFATKLDVAEKQDLDDLLLPKTHEETDDALPTAETLRYRSQMPSQDIFANNDVEYFKEKAKKKTSALVFVSVILALLMIVALNAIALIKLAIASTAQPATSGSVSAIELVQENSTDEQFFDKNMHSSIH